VIHDKHLFDQNLSLTLSTLDLLTLLPSFFLRCTLQSLQIPLYIINLLLYILIFSWEFLQKLKKILWCENTVVDLIQQSEYPEVYEFEITVRSVLKEVTELSEANRLREGEEMEKTL
jgi:hypothetical protein